MIEPYDGTTQYNNSVCPYCDEVITLEMVDEILIYDNEECDCSLIQEVVKLKKEVRKLQENVYELLQKTKE